MYVYIVNNYDGSWEDSIVGAYSSLHLATKAVLCTIKECYLDEKIPARIKEIENHSSEQIFVCEKYDNDNYKEIFEICIEKVKLDE